MYLRIQVWYTIRYKSKTTKATLIIYRIEIWKINKEIQFNGLKCILKVEIVNKKLGTREINNQTKKPLHTCCQTQIWNREI